MHPWCPTLQNLHISSGTFPLTLCFSANNAGTAPAPSACAAVADLISSAPAAKTKHALELSGPRVARLIQHNSQNAHLVNRWHCHRCRSLTDDSNECLSYGPALRLQIMSRDDGFHERGHRSSAGVISPFTLLNQMLPVGVFGDCAPRIWNKHVSCAMRRTAPP